MFAIEGEVHGLLTFESCRLVVVRTCLGLQHYALILGSRIEFLVADAVTVLPVVATVVETLERDLVVRVELIVERERVALAFASHIILTNLCLLELHFAFFLYIFKLSVVRSARGILI